MDPADISPSPEDLCQVRTIADNLFWDLSAEDWHEGLDARARFEKALGQEPRLLSAPGVAGLVWVSSQRVPAIDSEFPQCSAPEPRVWVSLDNP